MSKRKDLTSNKFGDYTVLELETIRNNDRAIWKVLCQTCGFLRYLSGSNLLNDSCTSCSICSANKKVNLTMEQIDEIEVLYMLEDWKAQDIADKYKVPRHIIYNLRKRFQWGNFKKKPLVNKLRRRPFRVKKIISKYNKGSINENI
jgi:predicted DNA-binding protein YlxM (UPF0122 family)